MVDSPYCWNCGGELPESAKFCPKCGAGVGEGTPGFLTPATHRYVEELILSNSRMQPGNRKRQLEREVGGALEDFELLSQLKGFSLADIWMPQSMQEASTRGSVADAFQGDISEQEASRLVGFLHLVRLVQNSVPGKDIGELGTVLDEAEMKLRDTSERD